MSNIEQIKEQITEKIMEQLKKGIIPWRRPWTALLSKDRRGIIAPSAIDKLAFNRFSLAPYSLLNQMLVGQPGEYGTFMQWKGIGGTVRKGERASKVIFSCWGYTKKEKNEDGEEVDVQVHYSRPVLKMYSVFHVSQVDGVQPLTAGEIWERVKKQNGGTEDAPDGMHEAADDIIEAYVKREKVFMTYGGNSAYYSPAADAINLPRRTAFDSPAEFFSTAFHEITHSTGTKNRLNRPEVEKLTNFGDEAYSREELTAEMGAAILCSYTAVETPETIENSAAYIQNWLEALKKDSGMVLQAATKAEKAARFVVFGRDGKDGRDGADE